MPTSFDTGFYLDDPKLISVLDELPLWSAPFGIKLLDKVKPQKNMTALDIGFGTGFPLIELAMRLGDTCRVYGIDPWTAAADRTREKIFAFGISNIEILPIAAENIPLADSTIDLVVSNNGLNNVEDPGRVLQECARVMKPGGQLVFTVNLEGTMMEFYTVMEDILANHHLHESIEAMKKHIHDKRKPLDEVLALLQKHGFLNASIDHEQFYYTFSDGSTMFRHFFIRLGFLDAWKQIVPVDKQLLIFQEIEARINTISEKEGCFRLSIPFVVIDVHKIETSSL